MGMGNPQRNNHVEVVTGMLSVPLWEYPEQETDGVFFKRIIQLWNLLYFTCREVDAKENRFKVLRESRTAVRVQTGTASDAWCCGHTALPYLYVPVREESITASSSFITYETGAFLQKNIVQAQLEKNLRKTSPLQCVRWVQVCHMNFSVALWWLYCMKQQFTVMNNCSNLFLSILACHK